MALRLLAVLTVLAGLTLPAAADARQRDLKAFASCDGLLGYARANASRMVGTGWLPSPGLRPAPPTGGPMPVAQEDAGTTGDRQTAAAPAPDVSTTNVQEEGVDEPDVVKTDGAVLYAVAGGVLHVVDVRSAPQRLLGTLRLAEGSGHELLLHGDRLLVLQNAWLEGDDGGRPVTRLTEVDVRDPAAPRVLRTDRVDGTYVTARRTGDMARVVISSPARAVVPLGAVGGRTRREAVAAAARSCAARACRPGGRGRSRATGAAAGPRSYPIVPCREVRRPSAFSGLDTTTVLTIDLDRGLPAVDADAVMTDAQTVYGSPSRLYVASSRWLSPQVLDDAEPPPVTTRIHAFDVSRREGTSYVGSGERHRLPAQPVRDVRARGRAARREHRHPVLVGPRARRRRARAPSPSSAAAPSSPSGASAGSGAASRSSRCASSATSGYVVTFRRIDPLYTVDLSTPSAPRVAGELKVLGYSAYLHPIGERLLLGVGQDADATGATSGTQLSVFDVADPANPVRTAVRSLGGSSSSAVEVDHRAFLWWAPKDLAVLPLQSFDGRGTSFAGAAGFGVTRTAVDERGRIAHPGADPSPITRTVVVGERLFTLSDRGLLASDLTTLAAGPFLAFSASAAPSGTAGGRTPPPGVRGTP